MPCDGALNAFYSQGAYDADFRDECSSSWGMLKNRGRAQVQHLQRFHPRPRSWLDIGAGYGYLLDAAKSAHVERTGAIETGPERRGALSQRGHFIYDSLNEAGGGWDVVSFSHVLEHVPRPVEFARAAAAALSAGGHLFCEVPDDSPRPTSRTDQPHVLFFSAETLRFTFESAGLRIVSLVAAGRSHHVGLSEKIQRGIFIAATRWHSAPGPVVDRLHPVFQERPTGIYLRAVAVPAQV